VENILTQIEKGLHNGHYMLALYATLALPDICASLESEDGKTCGPKYKAWFDKWVAPKIGGGFSGTQCWGYRCGVLHQGMASNRNLGYERIVFVEPRNYGRIPHMNIVNGALNVDVGVFCQNIVDGVREWMNEAKNTENFKRNIPNLMTRHSEGLRPYIWGVPVIG